MYIYIYVYQDLSNFDFASFGAQSLYMPSKFSSDFSCAFAGNNLNVRDGGIVTGLNWIRCMKPDEMLDAWTVISQPPATMEGQHGKTYWEPGTLW